MLATRTLLLGVNSANRRAVQAAVSKYSSQYSPAQATRMQSTPLTGPQWAQILESVPSALTLEEVD